MHDASPVQIPPTLLYKGHEQNWTLRKTQQRIRWVDCPISQTFVCYETQKDCMGYKNDKHFINSSLLLILANTGI